MSFDRLSVCRDAFEEIIKTSGAFAPLLQEIKVLFSDHNIAPTIEPNFHLFRMYIIIIL